MGEFSSLNGYQVKDAVARSIAKGRNQAVTFVDYETMIETLNGLEKDEYRAGQNIYIGVVGVPDLWVYGIEDIVHNFEYVSDEDIVEMLKNNTTIQVGYYKLAMLEGQKVDLTTYDQKLEELTDSLASFQNGVDTIVNGCTTYGSTPTSNTPTDIVNSIKTIYTDRYNAGYNVGTSSPKIISQTVTNSLHVAANSSGTLTLTFGNLPKISGISAMSFSTYYKLGATTASISGKNVSLGLNSASGSPYTFTATITAFYVQGT